MLVFASKARTALEVESGVCSAILVFLSLQVLVEIEKEVTTEIGCQKVEFLTTERSQLMLRARL